MNRRNKTSSLEADIKEILKGSYDLHIHCGPENLPRKYTPLDIGNVLKKYHMKGAVLKSHIQSTVVPIIQAYKCESSSLIDIDLIPSITLNWYVGGIRIDSVLAAKGTIDQWNSNLRRNHGIKDIKTLVVWFPTIHSIEHIASHYREIPKSWTGDDTHYKEYSRIAKRTKEEVFNIKKEVYPIYLDECEDQIDAILEVIAENNYILATGHISQEDSQKLVEKAVEKGVKKIIVTHPIYKEPFGHLKSELEKEGKENEIKRYRNRFTKKDQKENRFIKVISMKKEIQKELAQKGAYIEACYAMHSIDKIPIEDILEEIKHVGTDHVILTSDLGQKKSDPPPDGLFKFCKLLLEENHVSLDEIKKMLHDNPKKLIEG